jgi:hypothetical protein
MGKNTSAKVQKISFKKFLISNIFSIIIVLLGSSIFYFGVSEFIEAYASGSWPVIDGKIVESKVNSHSSITKKGRTQTSYQAEIQYTFLVDGVSHTGRRLSFGDHSTANSNQASMIVDQYPVNKTVSVHYMPRHPDVCVLQPGLRGSTWVEPLLGVALLGIGIWMIFKSVSK